jgi:magnesium and cobalt transporter
LSKFKLFIQHAKRVFKHWLSARPQTQPELIEQLRLCYEDNLINQDTFTMLECVIELAPMRVRDIVVPKSQMINIAEDATLSQVIQTVSESGHSRFPVTGESNDEIIGILHAKDLLRFQNVDPKTFDLYDLLRQAFFVPESKRLLTLLSEFRKNRIHMAIVVDEYGAVNGLVTLEDIIEQIIGEIEDEFDIDDETLIKNHGNHRYTVKGHTPIEVFNELFHADFSDESYDTIAGIITSHCGHLPKRGETLTLEGFQFKILHADARRIQLIECYDKRPKG